MSSYEKSAGGLDAIRFTLRHTFQEAGIIRGTRALLNMNQRRGFDCPGCAWPEPSHRSTAEFCENGAKAVADMATIKKADSAFFAKWSVEALRSQSDIWLNAQGRITQPMVKRPDSQHYTRIAWSEAFSLIASELNALSSPNEAIFYTSGRTSNEAAYLYQLFARQFGTNNLPDCSNMCHESSGTGMNESVGVGKGTVSLADFELADVILVVGQNPGTNHPRMLTALQAARRRGCHIVAINPIREVALERFTHPQHVTRLLGKGEAISSLFVPVKIGGDIALFKGIMKHVIAQRAVDRAFVDAHCSGFDEYVGALEKVSFEEICESSGLTFEQIAACAKMVIGAKRVIACWAMGLTQHEHGVGNIQEITNLMLMLGQIGKPGAGLCPVRGHSNVQGDRTMGIWEKPKAAFLDALAKRYDFAPPREHGYDTVDAIMAMRDGRAKVFCGLGGNFLSASPDTDVTAKALERCALTVHISTKLNRSHLHTGTSALILPTLSRVERDVQESGAQFVTVEDSMSAVHMSRGNLKPASPNLISEPAIVAHVAHTTLGKKSRLDWLKLAANYDLIRNEIEQVIEGFENFNERVRQPNGFVLPNAAAQRDFRTASGKANFFWHDVVRFGLKTDQILLMTIRSHDQFNTSVYTADDRYRGIHNNRMVLFMNANDMEKRGLKEDDVVSVTSHFRGEARTLEGLTVTAFDIAPSCTAAYFPECNSLVPLDYFATKSRTPASKSLVVTINA